MVAKAIAAKYDVERKICDSAEALSREEVVTVPGATYPEMISMIEIAGVSVEPCAGTHLRNTEEVGSLVVTRCSTPATGLRSLRALTGSEAESALKAAQEVDVQLSMLEEDLDGERVEQMQTNQLEDLSKKLADVKVKLEAPDFPLLASHSIQSRLERLQKAIQGAKRKLQAVGAEEQMMRALEEQKEQHFFLHSLFLQSNAKFSLAKAAKLVKNKPCLVISQSGGEVKGKSVVPAHLVTQNFDAEKWLREVAEVVKGQAKAPKGQDSKVHCNMLAVKVEDKEKLVEALARGQSFAMQNLSSNCDDESIQ